jgi:hypothetical protein
MPSCILLSMRRNSKEIVCIQRVRGHLYSLHRGWESPIDACTGFLIHRPNQKKLIWNLLLHSFWDNNCKIILGRGRMKYFVWHSIWNPNEWKCLCGRTAQIIWPTCACHCLIDFWLLHMRTRQLRYSVGCPRETRIIHFIFPSMIHHRRHCSITTVYTNILHRNKQRKSYKPFI